MTRTLTNVLTAAALSLLPGCSDGGPPPVASADRPGVQRSAAPSADALSAYVDGMRDYARCLRDEGLDVSGPDARGRIEFVGDPRTLKRDPAFGAAQVRCESRRPAHLVEEVPTRSPAEIETARRYARCMRENGAPDFPDPGPDGWFRGSDDGRPAWNQETDGARRAGRTCGPIVGEPANPGPGRG